MRTHAHTHTQTHTHTHTDMVEEKQQSLTWVKEERLEENKRMSAE